MIGGIVPLVFRRPNDEGNRSPHLWNAEMMGGTLPPIIGRLPCSLRHRYGSEMAGTLPRRAGRPGMKCPGWEQRRVNPASSPIHGALLIAR